MDKYQVYLSKFNVLLTPIMLSVSLEQAVAAEVSDYCPVPELWQADTQIQLPVADAIGVVADKTELIKNQLARFEGNVEFKQAQNLLFADKAVVDRQAKKVEALGHIRFRNQSLSAEAQDFSADLSSNAISLRQADYQLLNTNAKGASDGLLISQDEGFVLQDGTFSTCLTETPDWYIKASEIKMSPDSPSGEAWHTRFYVFDVPVFYLPYFRFPVLPDRQTGFLYPKIGSSSNFGLDIQTPFYWNIAPNMDATINPRYMVNRGLQLQTEFRYMSRKHQGQFDVEYLNKDTALINDEPRHYFRWQHAASLSENWTLAVDTANISDDNYINDLGSEHHQRSDTYIPRFARVNYSSDNSEFEALIEDFELIGQHTPGYRALPQLSYRYTQPQFGMGTEFNFYGQMAYFDSQSSVQGNAARLHLQPSVSYPIPMAYGDLLAEATVFHTRYHQQDVAQENKDIRRTIPQLRMQGKLNLERDSNLFGEGGVQMLEPQFQYLYTKYVDQGDIGIYDTSLLQDDFYGLFRPQRFSGLDRIAEANQVTLGASTRFFDKDSNEKLRLSLGQIFYLSDSKTQLADASSTVSKGRSALAADFDVRWKRRWYAHGDIQFDTENSNTSASNVAIEYRKSLDQLIQINHRFNRDISGTSVEQIGLVTSWRVNPRWQLVTRWYSDLKQKRTIESYVGLQYESCCWSFRVAAHRHINSQLGDSFNDTLRRDEFDSGISFKFQFRGMGNSSASEDMLKSGIFGYRKPYFLKN